MSNLISHAQRMYCHVESTPKVNYNVPFRKIARQQVVNNNRVATKNTWTEVLPSDSRKGLKASDYALENIIAAGAVGMLKEGYLRDSALNLSDAADAFLDSPAAEIPQNNETIGNE